MSKIKIIFHALRWKHWVKNTLIFLPFMLSTEYSLDNVLFLSVGFVCFSAIASSIYLINDIKDVDADRVHPTKKNRAIASGKLSVKSAFVIAIGLVIFSLTTTYLVFPEGLSYIIAYFLLNLFYSARGKRIRFIDILLLCIFYLTRIFFGAHIVEVEVTSWFIATLTIIFMTMALNKRYMELYNSASKKLTNRKYTQEDMPILHSLMITSSLVALVFLNIHAKMVLTIEHVEFYALINLCSFFIILSYFDVTNKVEDPVSRIMQNKMLFSCAILVLGIYIYYLNKV